jgi:hypothetical protein
MGCCAGEKSSGEAVKSGCCGPKKGVCAWLGCGIAVLVVLALGFSAWMKLSHQAQAVQMLVGTFGYPETVISTLGAIELLAAVLYGLRKTSFLGAVLLTGYLGGAVATHVRVQDAYVAPLVLGVLVWVGLYFRNPHVAKAVCGGKGCCKPEGTCETPETGSSKGGACCG